MKNKKVVIASIIVLVVFAVIVAVSVYASKRHAELSNDYYEYAQDDSVNITIEEDESFEDPFVVETYNNIDWRIATDITNVDKDFVYNYIIENAGNYDIDIHNINEISIYQADGIDHNLYVVVKSGGMLDSLFIDN